MNASKLLLGSFALILASSLASAADMPTRIPVRAPVVAPPPVAAWTGCYIGGNIGGGWADEKYTDPLAVFPDTILGSHTATGVVGGGQVGCDYQTGSWVFGVQGMFDGSDLRATHLAIGDFYRTHISSIAEVTGRIGYTWQPNWLFYVKGGGAWVRDRETKIDFVTGLPEGTAKFTRSGWVAGVGSEYMWPGTNWTIFVDYSYIGLGTHTVNYTNLEVPPVPPTFPLVIRQNVQVLLGGVNYRFGIK